MARPAKLVYVTVDGGTVLDTITLDADQLTFDTGVARQVFESQRNQPAPDGTAAKTDAELYDQINGWSNGYVSIHAPDGVAGEGGGGGPTDR
jgi:hypothetical protein